MARSRNIKPGFFTNEVLGELEPLARLLFAGLWCHADREGRLEDRLKRLRPQIFPFDDCNIEELAQCLHDAGMILRYVIDGKRYIQILNFKKHQNPHIKEAQSTIPAPDKNGFSMEVATLIPDSLNLIPDSLNPIKAAARANGHATPVDISVAMRSKGVNVNASHPDVISLSEQGVTTKTTLEAIRIAQEDRGKKTPSIKYLIPIINELLSNPIAKKSATMQAVENLEALKNGKH